MSALHLVIGPVGAGKSTFARRQALQERAVFLDLDTWMVRLFGKDARPAENVLDWYLERRGRCGELLWDLTREILLSGTSVFLEMGLVARAEREAFYAKVRGEDFRLVVYLLEAAREVRRERVVERNRAGGEHTQIVPLPFFEMASDAWEPPSEAEREAMGIVDV
ncbi:MAG: ATP-binding protein [Polyangiaceae bacterium]